MEQIATARTVAAPAAPGAPAAGPELRAEAGRIAPSRGDRARLGAAYWRLWTADGLSNLADGLLKVALPLLALTHTASPALIAGLPMAFSLPWLVFALPAGALVDRLDRRAAMLAATAVRALVLAGLAAAITTGHDSIQTLYAAAFAVGVAETVYGTSAQSILPQLVPRSLLTRANGRLFAVELAANEFAGPPLAGFVVAAGAATALLTPLGLFIVAFGVLLLVRGSFRVETDVASTRAGRPSLRADIAEGLRFVLHDKLLRTLAWMTGLYNLATNATFAVFVLYATGPTSALHLSGHAYGLLLAVIAAGSVLGSVIAERLVVALGRFRTLTLSVAGGTLLVGTPALTTNTYLIGTAFFVGGVGTVLWNVVAVSLRQRMTPDRLLGRVNSAYRLVAWGVMPVGAALGGAVAQAAGVRAVFGGSALVTLAMARGLAMVTEKRTVDSRG
jgi:MFS family permease